MVIVSVGYGNQLLHVVNGGVGVSSWMSVACSTGTSMLLLTLSVSIDAMVGCVTDSARLSLSSDCGLTTLMVSATDRVDGDPASLLMSNMRCKKHFREARGQRVGLRFWIYGCDILWRMRVIVIDCPMVVVVMVVYDGRALR